MIRFRLRELILDREFKLQSRISMETVALGTGIARPTLYKISTRYGYNTTTENLNRLCKYFQCELQELAEYVPDEDVVRPPKRKAGRPTAKVAPVSVPVKQSTSTKKRR